MSPEPRQGIDFFPLTIDFEERMYAVGKIPGSFMRREGRPSTDAVLAGRMTDRALRPLFPKGFRNDVQIIVTVLSADQENDPDVLATIGASAALCISNIPFDGPVSAVRVGYVDGEYVIYPTYAQLEESDLDLIVSSTRDKVIMVEAGAKGVSEDVFLEAVEVAHEANQKLIDVQDGWSRSSASRRWPSRPRRPTRPPTTPSPSSSSAAIDEVLAAVTEERTEGQQGAPSTSSRQHFGDEFTVRPARRRARRRRQEDWSAAASSTTASAPTAAPSTSCGRLAATSASCRARTAPASSSAARRRS